MSGEENVGGAVIINAKSVIVNNTLFTNCVSQKGGALTISASNTLIENSQFSANFVSAGDGGALWVDGGNLSVYNSQFMSNRAINGNGGAIYFTGLNLLVNTSTFGANFVTAKKGGAIYAEANVKIINSIFENQTTSGADAGGVYVKGDNLTVLDSSFKNNVANGGYGGALKFNGTNLEINNSKFVANVAQGRNGGAIYSEASSKAILNNAYFESNKVWSGAGGAIYNIGDKLIVNNITATDQISTASNGAGVIYTEGDLEVTNSNFTKNYGYTGVGVIHHKNGDLYVNNTVFNSNQGWNRDAGAIMTENSNIVVNNSDFTANTAGNMGGAIYAVDSTGSIDNSHFEGNTANNGAGSLHLLGDNFKIRNNTFEKTTKWTVGYIIVKGSNTLIDGCNFSDTNNNANSAGGAVASYGDNLTISNSNMYNINSSSVGGMIYAIGDNTHLENLNLNKSTSNYGAIFIQGDNAVLNNTNISNTLMNYGAIFWKGNNGTAVNSNFYNCDDASWGNGGGIFWSGRYFGPTVSLHDFVVDNCTFVECDGEGGVSTALSLLGDNVKVSNTDFINCTAPYGGALMTTGDNQTITNCTFIGNHAQVQGGAASIKGSNIEITGCNFSDNSANMWAGGILFGATNVTVEGCIFENNTSPDGGSILLLSGKNVNITNNTFANASMKGYGGAIENRIKTSSVFNDTSQITVRINNNTFRNLNVTGMGGAIMNYGAMQESHNEMTNCSATQGHDVMNYGIIGPVNLILDEKPRYIYVNQETFVPVDLVDDWGNPITVSSLTGVITDSELHSEHTFNYHNNEGGSSGFYMTFDKMGVYTFTPHTMQNQVLLNPGNKLTIIVTDRMPVEITLSNITAYPQDVVDYTLNITDPNGDLIANGTVTITINNNKFTIVLNATNKTATITDEPNNPNLPTNVYTVVYDGSITIKNVRLYDETGSYKVTAFYNNITLYYEPAQGNGTINIIQIPTKAPSINITGFVRDEVTFSVDVISENGRRVGGNVSFYLANVLVEQFIRLNGNKILAIGDLEGYPGGKLFTVKLRESLTLKLIVPMSGTEFPIFYYGDRVFGSSIDDGQINVTAKLNPTQTVGGTYVVDAGDIFNVTINVTSRYVVDENVVIVILENNTYGVPITQGQINRTIYAPLTPGTYVYPVAYVGGQSFLPSNSAIIVIVKKINVTIEAPDINAHPGDVVNITVNLTDKLGNKVSNGTVNTTINGELYVATVDNGTATFLNVNLGNSNGTFEYVVNYGGNDNYNPSSTSANINLTKIRTEIITVDIDGVPGENKTLNITLKDEDSNPINGTVIIKLINGSEIKVNVNEKVTVILPDYGEYEINVTFNGTYRYVPSNGTINVNVHKINTYIVALDVVGYEGDIVDIIAYINDENGNPVTGGNATLIIGDKITESNNVLGASYNSLLNAASGEFKSEVVDGKAVFKGVTLPSKGLYLGDLLYSGYNYYNPSNGLMHINVLEKTSNSNESSVNQNDSSQNSSDSGSGNSTNLDVNSTSENDGNLKDLNKTHVFKSEALQSKNHLSIHETGNPISIALLVIICLMSTLGYRRKY